jgi:hypothetical protein
MNKELLQFMKELDALIKDQAASSVSSGEILSHFKGSKLTRQQLLLICNYLISKGIDVSDYETLKEEAQAERKKPASKADLSSILSVWPSPAKNRVPTLTNFP